MPFAMTVGVRRGRASRVEFPASYFPPGFALPMYLYTVSRVTLESRAKIVYDSRLATRLEQVDLLPGGERTFPAHVSSTLFSPKQFLPLALPDKRTFRLSERTHNAAAGSASANPQTRLYEKVYVNATAGKFQDQFAEMIEATRQPVH